MLGYFPGDLIGHPVSGFLDETNRSILKQQLDKQRHGAIRPYEITWTRSDGGKISTILSPRLIFNKGGFKGSFAVITDITERKQTEEVLRESERQLRHLSFRLLTAQETERKRISSELHDELGQAFAVMKFQVTFVMKNLREDQIKLREECEQTLQCIDRMLENVRRLSRDLSPYSLESLGLPGALRRLIEEFEKNSSVRVTLEMVDVDHLFPQDDQIVIYRIFQESLTNIRKHAQAKNVSVAIRKDDDKVSFSIADDGKGFDVKKTFMTDTAGKGIGLTIIDERVQMLKGSLDLRSQEGKGTRITFVVPLEKGRNV
jgi:signal transduction histidine kinase